VGLNYSEVSMEILSIYQLVVVPEVGEAIIKKLDEYHELMSRPTINMYQPTEFRIPGILTIENLRMIRGYYKERVDNVLYRDATIKRAGENYPGKFDPDTHNPFMYKIHIEVYQVVKL